ncbi:hypothetical protein GPALN_011013 [Globodera pallida]|nr:hypothetical protein GPALN_011013 [Globodera pallida]
MNTTQSFFLITLLLITALLALTVLLIVVTEQPDSMIEGRHRVVQIWDRGGKRVQNEVSSGRDDEKSSSPQVVAAGRPSVPSSSSTDVQPHSSSPLPMDFTLEKLAQFGPSDGGKFMGIQLLGDYLYLPKDDGRIEVRDSRRLFLNRTVSTGIRIHRLRAVNERIFVILDNSFGRLVLFDASSGTVLRERSLEEPAKELTLDDAVVHTLARFGTQVHSFELDDLRAVTPNRSIDIDQHNCNFISGDGTGALLISCGSAILRMSKKSSFLQCFTPPTGVNYSALLVTQSGKLLVVNKAQRALYLMDKNLTEPIVRLHQPDGGRSSSIWIWTSFALDIRNGTLFILEYISNRVEVFKIPSDVLRLL